MILLTHDRPFFNELSSTTREQFDKIEGLEDSHPFHSPFCDICAMTEVGRNPAVLYLFGKLLKSTFCGGGVGVIFWSVNQSMIEINQSVIEINQSMIEINSTSCSVIFLYKATNNTVMWCCLVFVSKPANNFCFFKGNLFDEESILSVVGQHIVIEINQPPFTFSVVNLELYMAVHCTTNYIFFHLHNDINEGNDKEPRS